MRLRHHPKLRWKGSSTWPPELGGSYGPGTRFPTGEEGVLKEVRLLDADRIGPARLELDVKYEGHTFSGNLLSEDPKFLQGLPPSRSVNRRGGNRQCLRDPSP